MSLNKFFIINAIMFIPFGIGMLVLPTLIFELIDVHLDNDGILMANTVGSMLLSFGLMCLVGRKVQGHSPALAALLLGNLSFHSIDSFLTFKAAFSGVMNDLGYVFSGMHFLFALGFLFFFLKKSKL